MEKINLKIALIDKSTETQFLENFRKEFNTKIISFDYPTHIFLKEKNIPHEISEKYSNNSNIQELQKTSGCTIVINEDPDTEQGIVEILGTDQEGIDMVLSHIESMLFKPEVGSVYEVKVIKLLDFGAVVEYCEAPGNEVLLHISELAWEKTENVTDVVNLGDTLDVKYFGVDPRTRKDKVSRKALLPKPEGYVDKPRKTFNRNNNRKGFNKK